MLPFSFSLPATTASVSFVTLGDWGGAALKEHAKPYAQNVKDVASALEKIFHTNDVKFLVNTGDNFYYCGIQNTSDFQVMVDWVDTYADTVRAVNWYSVLGSACLLNSIMLNFDACKGNQP